jgi:multidrug efflux pump subunit AcrA (membrane-fusion protein)
MDRKETAFNSINPLKWAPKTKGRKAFIVLILLSCVVFAALKLVSGAMGAEETLSVKPQKYEEKIVATGLLQLEKETELVAEVSGIVKNIEIDDGISVSAGAVILSIDSSDLEYELKQKESAYLDEKGQYENLVNYEYQAAAEDLKRFDTARKKAEADWKAAELLYQEGAISGSERMTAKSAYDSSAAEWKKASLKAESLREGGSLRSSAYSQMMNAQSAYESKLEEKNKYTITAPWDAILLKTYVKEQQSIDPGDILADIGEAGSSYVAMELDEKYFPYLFKGMKAEIKLGDSRLFATEGTITVISPKINENTGTFSIEIGLPEDFPFQASDLTVNLEILISEDANAILIPQQYLIAGEHSVYIYADGKAMKKKIEYRLGLSGNVVVTSGLAEGDILIKPGKKIYDGKSVRIKK